MKKVKLYRVRPSIVLGIGIFGFLFTWLGCVVLPKEEVLLALIGGLIIGLDTLFLWDARWEDDDEEEKEKYCSEENG